jgi:hypothetical protein
MMLLSTVAMSTMALTLRPSQTHDHQHKLPVFKALRQRGRGLSKATEEALIGLIVQKRREMERCVMVEVLLSH